jgi:hypothetical protein
LQEIVIGLKNTATADLITHDSFAGLYRRPHSLILSATWFGSGILAPAFVVLMLALGVIWTRGQRVLGNDAFFYNEYAKSFKGRMPDHLGDWWPYGFPLAGSFVSQIGLSTHAALLVVSGVSFLAILMGIWWALPQSSRQNRGTLLIIAAAVCAPVCPLLLMGTMSEPMFSAALFGVALSLGLWPQRLGITLSLVLALLAFSARYVGIFTFGVVMIHALFQWRELSRNRNATFFAIAFGTAILAVSGLCYTNYRTFGPGHRSTTSGAGESSNLAFSPR